MTGVRPAPEEIAIVTYSPLTTEMMPPVRQSYGEKWSPRPPGGLIDGLIVHHNAATNDSGITRLVTSADMVSANYIIRTGGALIGSVPEESRAWTSGSYAADDDKITVEVQDETGAPEWRISDAAMATLVKLYADVAARHGFTPDRTHITGHRDWAATACPGPYLYAQLDWVAQQAGGGAAQVSYPVTPPATAGPVAVAPSAVAPPYPLPDGFYFGPRSGPKDSVSGFFGPYGNPTSGAPGLRAWQEQMAARGWAITADGFYGSQTAGVAHDFQVEKHLGVDSLIGPQTWAAAWTAPVTR